MIFCGPRRDKCASQLKRIHFKDVAKDFYAWLYARVDFSQKDQWKLSLNDFDYVWVVNIKILNPDCIKRCINRNLNRGSL